MKLLLCCVVGLAAADTTRRVAAASAAPALSDAPPVFISEYVEGTAFNKVVELYNAGSQDLVMDSLALQWHHNGKDYSDKPFYAVDLAGQTIGAGDTYVVCRKSTTSNRNEADEQARCDLTVGGKTHGADVVASAVLHNGDDAIELKWQGAVIDIIGEVGTDPGSCWKNSDNKCVTKDATLRRKPSVTHGYVKWDPSQWDVVDKKDDHTGVGSHTQVSDVDCVQTQWSTWSACSHACYTSTEEFGLQIRTRTTTTASAGEGRRCGPTSESAMCNTQCCAGYEHRGDEDTAASKLIVTQASAVISQTLGDVTTATSQRLITVHTEVESVRSSTASYQIARGDAAAICAARGSNWKVCTTAQIRLAFQQGLRGCKCGWASDGKLYKTCGGDTPAVSDCDGEVYDHANMGDAFCCGQRRPPTCTKCAAGRFSAWQGTGQCHVCYAGKYQSATGATKCLDCPAGHSSPAGATSLDQCVKCGHGKYTAGGVCADCPPGTEHAFTGGAHKDVCIKCAPGFYAASQGTRQCSSCEQGTWQNARGAAKCEECAKGKFNPHVGTVSRTGCVHCDKGTYSLAAAASCIKCAAGTFSKAIGAGSHTTCASCAAGTVSSAGAASCTACQPGHYQNGNQCTACAAGTYRATAGGATSEACAPCPAGHFCPTGASMPTACAAGTQRDATGGKSADDCAKCIKGYHAPAAGALKCAKCEPGTYGAVTGMAECTECAAGTAQPLHGATEESFCELCHAGRYQPHTRQTFCVPCGKGYYEPATGASECTACPTGRFGQAHGVVALDDACIDCSAGKYNDQPAAGACQECSVGKFSTTVGATTPLTCEHCDWGQFTRRTGQTECEKCSRGTYGQKQATAKGLLVHCQRCPHGHYQKYDGSSECLACEAGKYAASSGHHECKSCAAQDKDSLRKYWSASGATECYAKKLDCKMSDWTEWGECSKKCGGGVQKRTRSPARQEPCGLATGCDQAWGVGAKACSAFEDVQERPCKTVPCAQDCVLGEWGAWGQCTKSCGKGETTRHRKTLVPAKYGGQCNGSLSQGTFCNAHTCDFKQLPRCHNQHVHCRVVAKEMNKWQDEHDTNKCPLWHVHWSKDDKECHRCDTAEECALHGVHNTLQVTHDKKYSAKEQRNSFHCFSDRLSTNQCFCTCSQHPPCTSVEGKTLNNVAIRGNTWESILKQQDCCNMCTNHPICGSYTFDDAAKTCTLYEGSPDYADASAPSTTWSGCQSGDFC